MRCPVDGTTLLLSERNQVEIDYCPECRGVWLDRGEIDKIVEHERSNGARDTAAPNQKKKKKGFLSEMFEGLGGE